jgi:hypothetical protein
MLKKTLGYFTLSLFLLFGASWANADAQSPKKNEGQTGTRERMIVGNGKVTMDLDLERLRGIRSEAQELKRDSVRFEVGPNSFFTVLVFNGALRGPQPGTMGLIGGNPSVLPAPLNASADQLVIEKTRSGEPFDLVVRDGKTGVAFFNIEGQLYEYDSTAHSLSINGGRLLISEELANKLGHPADAGAVVGEISITASMYSIEESSVVNGAVKSSILPPRAGGAPNATDGARVPGPDIIVGNMSGLQQFGSTTTQVGLAIGTTSCNNGNQEVHFFQIPSPDHSVVAQSLYRLSSNSDRLEQLGYAWIKHTFGANQDDDCDFGCVPAGSFDTLGVGCSDPYDASQNGFQGNTDSGALGSRAWVNPFTGIFPTSPRPENHTGHTHNGVSHRVTVDRNDLNTTMNAGATYYAEVQYDSPHEYAWCQAHPGECNMYNNASYRRYNVSGTTGSFNFAAVGSTVRMTPATGAWPGATSSTVEPVPGVDGRAFIVYKVTNPSAGVWHYEYLIHNQNLDRSIQSFSVPLGCGTTLSNIAFRAPPNHPGFANDGTVGNAGFSNVVWTAAQTSEAMSWNTETFAQNPNANAIRYGTSYNFRFDSNRPPQAVNATVGFLKTGTPITVGIEGPSPDTCTGVTPTPTPGATATPGSTATPTPSGPTPTPPAQPLNLSTRMQVQTGDNVGIGGFIVTGTAPKHVLLRAIGPSLTQSGVPNALADTVLELHGPGGFVTMTNDNWRENAAQEAAIIATGIAPTNDLESAIDATLAPGVYSAVIKGKNNSSGVGLVEVYDLSQAIPAKLANISTRAFVSTGDNVVIAGFQLGGGSSSQGIVTRGIGPSLTAAGVLNALADPTLELRDGNGAVLASNNNWQDDLAQAAQLTALGLAPSNPSESAIVSTLPGGVYTALLSGVNSGVGVGLVEVYDLGTP